MLLEFSCRNHRSIKDEILFSMLASHDNSYIERCISFENSNILRSAVIYGANGSGKSNFIDAISFVKSMVVDSFNFQPGMGAIQFPHLLEGFSKPSKYDLQFSYNDIRYAYGFVISNASITKEYLYYFPNGRKTIIFDRELQNIEPGASYKNRFINSEEVLKPNNLLLSCAARFSKIDEIVNAYLYFRDNLVIHTVNSDAQWQDYTLHLLNKCENMKKSLLILLNELKTDIKDIEVKIDKKKLDETKLPPFLNEEFKQKMLEYEGESITTKIVYDQFKIDLDNESTGIKKLFSFLCPFLDVVVGGKTLICDELGTGLHESITYSLVDMFNNFDNAKRAQLIFTTHNSSLLYKDLFRRDQIWFTELNKKYRSTDLYSLAEIRNIRKDENFQKGYISGKYGSIPIINTSSLIDIIKFEGLNYE